MLNQNLTQKQERGLIKMEDKKEIFGYKSFNENLQAFNGFQYEIGKTYEIEEAPIIGRIGFHFCDTLKESFLNNHYHDNPKFCKVKILGDVDKEFATGCTNKIEILEEIIIDEELKKSILDELIDDERWVARDFVAQQGYGLEKLIDDKEAFVRYAVAEQGYGLEKLIDDKDYFVRLAVARQGFGLEKLIDDKNRFVRGEVLDYIIENYSDLAQEIKQLVKNYFNKAEE
jgi:hypothetical protein